MEVFQTGPSLLAEMAFIDGAFRVPGYSEDAAALSEGLVPGSLVFALAIEHVWAIGLVNAIMNAGAEIGASIRIPADVVSERFAALEAAKQ